MFEAWLANWSKYWQKAGLLFCNSIKLHDVHQPQNLFQNVEIIFEGFLIKKVHFDLKFKNSILSVSNFAIRILSRVKDDLMFGDKNNTVRTTYLQRGEGKNS